MTRIFGDDADDVGDGSDFGGSESEDEVVERAPPARSRRAAAFEVNYAMDSESEDEEEEESES
jgi:hypothetical protein